MPSGDVVLTLTERVHGELIQRMSVLEGDVQKELSAAGICAMLSTVDEIRGRLRSLLQMVC